MASIKFNAFVAEMTPDELREVGRFVVLFERNGTMPPDEGLAGVP